MKATAQDQQLLAVQCQGKILEFPRLKWYHQPSFPSSIQKKPSWCILVGGSASFFHMSGLLSVLLWPLLVTAGLWGMLMTCGPWTLPCSKNSIDQDFQQCGRRRKVPSPEQGTSQITLSYLWPNIPRSGQYIQFCYLWRILESPLAPDISMQVSTMTINRCIQTRTVL